jgi:hypothetical protein
MLWYKLVFKQRKLRIVLRMRYKTHRLLINKKTDLKDNTALQVCFNQKNNLKVLRNKLSCEIFAHILTC